MGENREREVKGGGADKGGGRKRGRKEIPTENELTNKYSKIYENTFCKKISTPNGNSHKIKINLIEESDLDFKIGIFRSSKR